MVRAVSIKKSATQIIVPADEDPKEGTLLVVKNSQGYWDKEDLGVDAAHFLVRPAKEPRLYMGVKDSVVQLLLNTGENQPEITFELIADGKEKYKLKNEGDGGYLGIDITTNELTLTNSFDAVIWLIQ